MSHRAFDDNPSLPPLGLLPDGLDGDLAEQAARFLESSPDLLSIAGYDGLIRWTNPAYESVLGYAPDELVGRTFADVVHPDDLRRALDIADHIAQSSEPAEYEVRLVPKDGAPRWFQFNVRPQPDIEALYAVGRDITERRRADEELALGHDLSLALAGAESVEVALAGVLRSVCERTGWAIGQAWVLTDDGRALVCSPAWHASQPGLEPFRRLTEALSFVRGIGLPGKAWELGRPVWTRDAKSDPAFERGLFAQDAGLAAGVAVPVLARDEVVAVMEFFVWEEREEDERLVALVSAVAAQLGTVIQRKEAQEALRVSEEHFRAVADTAADAILSIDAEGVVCYANAAATAVFGFSAEDLQGKPLTLLLPAGVPQRGAADHRLVEVTGRRHNGDEFPIEAAFSQWSAGSDVLTTAMLRDISERKRDQAAVHEAEERFRGAFEHAPIGMALVSIESDRAGCFLRVNRALCDLVGHSAEELVGRPFAGLSDGAESESPDARYVPWMLAGEVAEYEVEQRLQRADGKAITATVSVSLVRDAAERPLYLIVQVQDVTARKQAEQALIESRERVQAIIDNTAAVIYVKDLEGRYSLVNRSFETLFHIGRDRATGHTDEELFEPQMASSMRANDRRVMREHIPLQVEEVIDQADGPHTYLSAKFPLLDSTGKPYAVCAIATDITQRKRAEEGLRDSERHFRQIVDTAHDAFISMDATGRITAWNPQSEATFGWTEAEAVGRNLAETIIPARYRATHHRALEQFMKTGKGKLLGRRVELEALHRDGHEFPVEFTISAVRVGGTYAFNAFLHDITERKQAEETMRRLADVVQSSHDAIIATTSAGEITAWNQGAAELYGYTAEEVAGRMIEVLMPEGHSGSDGPLLAQAFAGRRLEDHETEHRRKDGSLVPVSLSVSPMRDSRRAITGASVIVRDRTERKRAEEAMREVQEAFRRAFEDAPIGMALFGVSAADRARLLQVNNSLSQITGYARRELESMTLEQVTHPYDLDEEEPLLDQLLRGAIPNYQLEKRFLRGDGETVWVMYNASTVHDSSGRLLYGIAQVQDITLRKRTEDRLAKVAAELERRATELERSNADLQEFAYVASHDLSEPLRMVSSYTQLLARRYGEQLDSDAHEFIGFAVDGVNRMQRLIDDLLAYSRAGTQEYRIGPVDTEELVRDTLGGMQATIADSGATIIVDDLPTVRGDEGQLRQLFQNLIGNGMKFRADDPPRVEVAAEHEGSAWRFSVEDNGIGIDPRHAERIFSVFKRLHTRDKYPGSGVGLSICKRIVERHQGRIWVEQGELGGSRFCFTIPDRIARDGDPGPEAGVDG